MEDIAFHQSILDRILGIGTIRVISHDENMPDLHMRAAQCAKIVRGIEAAHHLRQAPVRRVETGFGNLNCERN